jgi:glycosyltransferase involved in cell wall biosynthesis
MSPSHEVSVVICTCDRRDLVPSAIDSVLAQTIPIECIIIDNSPDPGINHAARERYQGNARFRYAIEPAPGLSNARNRGVALADSRIIAFLDDDAAAAPDWAENLLAAFEAFPRAGCVGGRIAPDWFAPPPVWLDRELQGWLSIVDWGGVPRETKRGEWLAGCNIAYDRQALVAAGGFPAALGRKGAGLLSNEEILVNEKLKAAGRGIVYAPDAVVQHKIPAERLTREWFLRRAAWQGVSDFMAFAPPPGWRQALYWCELRLLSLWQPSAAVKLQLAEIHALVLKRLNAEPQLIENLEAEGPEFLARSLRIDL